MNTVSVVMATYNGAEFIEEQLTSLAAQTVLPGQLVVSDDCSTDRTLEIVERFCENAPFPVVVRRNERRLGYGENFLSATRLATGDFIAFCDQDDVWDAQKLEIAVERLVVTSADLFVHPATVIDRNGDRTGAFSQSIGASAVHRPLQLAPWGVLYGCSMVFSRRLLELVDPAERGAHTFEWQGMLSHDLWIYFLATSIGSVVVDHRPLIHYRQHGANATPTVLNRSLRAWTTSLGVTADPRLRRADIARHRSRLTSELSLSGTDASVRPAAAAAARYWQSIARFEDGRGELYMAEGGLRRAGRCVDLVRRGAYRPYDRGGLGRRLLLKDLLFGVLQVRRVKALSRGRGPRELRVGRR
jgi:glycosyltransferase involved in cell wall biosynthesis